MYPMGATVVAFALLLDRVLGEPARFHPLVGFGHCVAWVEKCCNRSCYSALRARTSGVLALILLVAPCCGLVYLTALWLAESPVLSGLFSLAVLYLVIGGRSLEQHGQAVLQCLMQKDLSGARQKVGYIVSRETEHLDEQGVAKATIESILENGSDALFAPLFWFLLAGPVGAVGYRLVNTLDAMWGYRSERYLYYGWGAARLDDLLNWIPARCCALSYALLGNTRQGLACWWSQAPHCESPNAGPVMASGAGALNLALGGPAFYHGQHHDRPLLGSGSEPAATDINRAIQLVRRVTWMWLLLVLLIESFSYWSAL